jgi:hypothetical protein
MTTRSYDLSIISDQEASERLGIKAAEAEELLEGDIDTIVIETDSTDPDGAWVRGANRATIALDILALRKAQVALEENRRLKQQLSDCDEAYDNMRVAYEGAVHDAAIGPDL